MGNKSFKEPAHPLIRLDYLQLLKFVGLIQEVPSRETLVQLVPDQEKPTDPGGLNWFHHIV